MVMSAYMYVFDDRTSAPPSYSALTLQTSPACRSVITVVWRRVCGVIFLVCSFSHVNAAVASCLANRCSTASRLKRLPLRVENNGSTGRCVLLSLQDQCRGMGQGNGAFLAFLAAALDVDSGARANVTAVEACQL